jgi:hypothetical protein
MRRPDAASTSTRRGGEPSKRRTLHEELSRSSIRRAEVDTSLAHRVSRRQPTRRRAETRVESQGRVTDSGENEWTARASGRSGPLAPASTARGFLVVTRSWARAAAG